MLLAEKKKQDLSSLVMTPESYLELAMIAFLWDRPLINSVSIHCAKIIKAFFPFAELAFPLLLGSACLSADITVTAAQTSSRIFSIWFGLSLFVEAGRIPWIPSGCYQLTKHFLLLVLMEGFLEVMKCKREGVLCKWWQNFLSFIYISTGRSRWLTWKEKALQVTKGIFQPFCIENPSSCAPEE